MFFRKMLLSKTIAPRVFSLSPQRCIVCYSSFSSSNSFYPPSPPPKVEKFAGFDSKDVALSFKDWFKSRDDTLLDRIFEILASKDDNDLASVRTAELKLNQLGLKLNDKFVLRVLNHGKDVLSCLKFFDWAGRQRGYYHTRAAFNAIFKILSRNKLMPLMLDLLETFKTQRGSHKVQYYDTLVVGYAIAGKPDIALKWFGAMRFKGIDLDPFAYHVFLNAMAEQGCFDVVEVIFKQIKLRGLENGTTSCIRVKTFCKQNKLKEAVDFLRGLESEGHVINDQMVGVLVDAHVKKNKFKEACRLMEEFWGSGKVPLGQTYGVWIRDLVQAGKLDWALEFLRNKKILEGYVPDVFRYNILICQLLRENRLDDVCDLLTEMMEGKISPDKITMNAALCFFCKAGRVNVALELYNLRSEFGLSLNSLSYNYLINTLCGDGNVDEAYRVLKDAIPQGYFPGKKASSIIADALCREGKLDKMKELIIMALELNVVPSDAVCIKFISALCKARRVEDGYLIYEELNRTHKVTNKYTFFDMIRGFNRAKRGDMAARLLIEMQENGHSPTRELYRAVICCICTMDNPDNQFFNLLEMQLSRQDPNNRIYNFFIDGAGHAKRPDLARHVYEMMARNQIEPNNDSKLFMLQSYLKSERIADALNFYDDLCKKIPPERSTPGRKLNNTMVVGLSKANKPELALEILRKLREKGAKPSLECYEELVKSFCSIKNYDMVVEVIDDLIKTQRQVSSFIGNVLLLHSFRTREVYQAWVRSGVVTKEASQFDEASRSDEASQSDKVSQSNSLTLGELVGLFSGGFRVDPNTENVDQIIEHCFPLDIFTYNMLLRRLSMTHRWDCFIELVDKMHKRGYEGNKWTYDIIVDGLCKHDRRDAAMKWANEAYRLGFDLTERTLQLL